MRPDIKIDITVGTLRAMSKEQFEALKSNVLADGLWETADGLRLSGNDPLGVVPTKYKRASAHLTSANEPLIYIGIEPDGYTHS